MLKPKKVGLVLAETTGIVYVVCAAVVAVAPGVAWQLVGWLAHVTNLDVLGRSLSFGGFLGGLVQILVYSYATGWLFATLYNRAERS